MNTITQLIAQRRVDAAKVMLLSGGASVSEIAGAVGFSDYNYFARIFKSFTGMSPRAFRKGYTSPTEKD